MIHAKRSAWKSELVSNLKLVLALVAALLSSACLGNDFVRPHDSSLSLGVTTAQQIQEQMGKPRTKKLSSINDKEVIITNYLYAPLVPTETARQLRHATFYFHNDILVGYQFMSTFSKDSTDFVDARWAVKKGVTREEEVLKWFGRPSGMFIYPVVDREGKRLAYSYLESRSWEVPLKILYKYVRIDLDRDGVVTDVDFQMLREGSYADQN